MSTVPRVWAARGERWDDPPDVVAARRKARDITHYLNGGSVGPVGAHRDKCAVCGTAFIPWTPDGKGGALLWFCSQDCQSRALEAAIAAHSTEGARLKHAGRTCQCSGCKRTFSGLSSFDAHRIGSMDARRCATDVELAGFGLRVNEHGHYGTASEPSELMLGADEGGELPANMGTDERRPIAPAVRV